MSMGGRGGMPGSERPQKNPNQQTEPETTESDEETTTVPNADVQTTQPQPPEMNGDFPEFNGELPPNFNGQMPELPEGFSPPNGQMPPMNGEMPNFNSEFPAPPPNNVNSFGNASMLSMSS